MARVQPLSAAELSGVHSRRSAGDLSGERRDRSTATASWGAAYNGRLGGPSTVMSATSLTNWHLTIRSVTRVPATAFRTGMW